MKKRQEGCLIKIAHTDKKADPVHSQWVEESGGGQTYTDVNS